MSCLHLHILGSGSKGNCALIEGPQGLIMVDDGLSRRETLKRMAELGLSTDNVSALLITHEHSDHIKGLDVWCKHWHGPLFASRGTLSNKENLSHLPVEEFDPGDTLSIAASTCKPTQRHTMSSIQSAIDSTPSMIPSVLPPTPESYRAKP